MSQGSGQVPRDRGDGGVPWTTYVNDVVSSAALVLLVGVLLFAVSGVWPPLVAIESGSMNPNIAKGDLVFVMDEKRFPGEGYKVGTGVVTARAAEDSGYSKFNGPGDVIVFAPDGNFEATPIIHRARFWVSEGENWYEKANQNHIDGASDCQSLANCPAPNDGFITKGDANQHYDQVNPLPSCNSECSPVKPAWVKGTAEFRVPALGHIRLQSSDAMKDSSALSTASAEAFRPGSSVLHTTAAPIDVAGTIPVVDG